MHRAELVQRLSARLREGGRQPASQLIAGELWLAVVEGALDVGERLPTTRQLAIALGVDPRSVERAYDDLERRGVTSTRPGAGTFVSLTAPSVADHDRYRAFAELCAATVQRAAALGFTIDDMIDAITEFRAVERDTRTGEHGP